MAASIRTSITLPPTLRDQAAAVAQALHISRNQLFAQAAADFIQRYEDQTPAADDEPRAGRGAIQQGELYWVQLDDASGAEPGVRHPQVVVQADVINHSRIETVVVCALTSNLKRAKAPGNVLLEAGEGQLAKRSVVEVSKVSAIAKAQLGDYIGSLSARRTQQILAGMRFLQRSFRPGHS